MPEYDKEECRALFSVRRTVVYVYRRRRTRKKNKNEKNKKERKNVEQIMML